MKMRTIFKPKAIAVLAVMLFAIAGIAVLQPAKAYDSWTYTGDTWAPNSHVHIAGHTILGSGGHLLYHLQARLLRQVTAYCLHDFGWAYHGETGWDWIKTLDIYCTGEGPCDVYALWDDGTNPWGYTTNQQVHGDTDWLQGDYITVSKYSGRLNSPLWTTEGMAYAVQYKVLWYSFDIFNQPVDYDVMGVSTGVHWSYDGSVVYGDPCIWGGTEYYCMHLENAGITAWDTHWW